MQTLRARLAFRDSTVKVVVVEAIDIARGETAGVNHVIGKAEPVAIVVCDPHGSYATDAAALPLALDSLRAECPALDAFIQ